MSYPPYYINSQAVFSPLQNLMPFRNGNDRSILLPSFSQDYEDIDNDDPWERRSGTIDPPPVEKIEKIISSTLKNNKGLQRSLTSPNFSSSKNGVDRKKYQRSKCSLNSMDDVNCNESIGSSSTLENVNDEIFSNGNHIYQSVCRPKRARSHSTTGIQSSLDENFNFLTQDDKHSSCQSIPLYATIGTNTSDSLKRPKKKGKTKEKETDNCVQCENRLENRLSAVKPTSFPEKLHNIHLSNFLHDESPEMQVVVNATSPVISRRSRRNFTRQQSENSTTSSCNDEPVYAVPEIKSVHKDIVKIETETKSEILLNTDKKSDTIMKHSNDSSVKEEKKDKQGKGLLRSKSKKKSKESEDKVASLSSSKKNKNSDINSKDNAMNDINSKECKLMKKELSKTWHGISSRRWKKFYSPVAQAVWNDLEGKGQDGSKTDGEREEENLKLGSSTMPGKTLLDEMHKKYCAYQYKDRLGLPDDLELPLKLKSSPPPPDRMKSKAWIMKHYVIPPGKGAISTPSSPEQAKKIWINDNNQREITPVETVDQKTSISQEEAVSTTKDESQGSSPDCQAEKEVSM